MAGQSPASDSASKSGATKGPALIPLGHHTGKPPIPLHRSVTVIGSRSNARIHLTSSTVSKAHALVVKDGPITYIRDLSSRTHVYVNGDKIRDQILENDDLIKIGSFTFKFKSGALLSDPGDKPASAQPAKLEVSGADYPVPIDERVLLIGRRKSCDVHLLEDSASTAHAVIFEMNGHRHVRDLGSRTGTYVNGVAVHQHQLNPGDHIRIGETTLTYTPTAELSIASPHASASGSVLDLDVVDDTDQVRAAREAAERDEIELGRPGAPHIPEDSREPVSTEAAALDALGLDELEVASDAPEISQRQAAPIGRDSAEKGVAPPALSEAGEKLRPGEKPSDSDSRSDASTSEVGGPALQPADEDVLRPRRGWRPAAAVSPQGSAEAVAPATPPPAEKSRAQQQDEDLLRISPTTSPTNSDNEFGDDAPGADQGAAAVLDIDEPQITAGQFAETRADNDNASDDLLDLAIEEIDEQPDKPKRIEIDLSQTAPPLPAREAKPLESLDFSTVDGDASSAEPVDVADEPIIEPIVTTTAPGMRFDRDEPKRTESPDEALPLIEIDAVPAAPSKTAPPAEAGKPAGKRGPKGKKDHPVVERVAASRTRRKPVQSVADQTPADAVAQQPALEAPKKSAPVEPVPEVVDQTEPTPESALDLDGVTSGSTTGATFDEASIAQTLGEPTASDPLSDTGLTRAMHDLSGDVGEIVETPGAQQEIPPRDPAAEEAPTTESTPEAKAEHKQYRWGANQDNFLGGVPVTLPPVPSQSPISSRRPATPVAPAEKPIEAQADAEIDLSADAPENETGQQIDEVNALIDEILAPASDVAATRDDLLAHSADDAKSSDGDDTSTDEATGTDADELIPDLLDDMPPPLPLPPPDEPAVAAKLAGAHDVHHRVDHGVDHGPSQSRPVIPIPPPPLRGRRPRRSERSEAAPSLREDERIPPYAGAVAATRGRVTTSFDGLAMPPVREVDVFSQMSPPATSTGEDPFSGVTAAPSPSALTPMDLVQAEETPRARRAASGRAQAPRDLFFGAAPMPTTVDAPSSGGGGGHRRRPPVRPAIPGSLDRAAEQAQSPAETLAAASRRAAVVMGEESAEPARQQRRRRVRWLTTLCIAGVLLWGGALAAIYYLFVPSSLTEVAVRFRNYDALSISERRQLQDEQQKLLNIEATRIAARRHLSQSDPEIPPGFLDDVERYLATASRTAWPENRKGVLLLSHKGSFDSGDRARMVAMGQALYSQNESRISDGKRIEQQLQQLREAKDSISREKNQLAQEIEALRIQGDSAPDTRQINQIRDEVQQLDKAWGDALAAVKSAEAELRRLKQAAPADAKNDGSATAQPLNDDTLAAMETQLNELTGKLTAAQAGKNEQAAAARKALDQSLAGFETQIGAARELMKDSPELSAYVVAAQRLQETTRVVIDDIIRRQEQQYGRLIELKSTLTEKMEQRRAEQLGGDPQLKDLNARLATASRQLSAAKNSGMKRETDDKEEEVKLLASMIKAREEMLPKDPAMKDFADTIVQIEHIIDTVQGNVENDRKRADQLLTDAQQNFAANAAVEKLPEAQKSVAANLEKQLADINAARQQYNQAISATAVDDDESLKQLRTQAAALQTAIDGRKKDLADASSKTTSAEQEKARLDMIPLKEKDLLELRKAEANARQAYTNRDKDYRDAQAAAKLARDSLDRLTELQAKQDTLDKRLAQANADLPLKEEQAKRTVMPDAVTDADANITRNPDYRWPAGIASSAVILVVFAGLMLFAVHNTSGGMPMTSIDEIGNAVAGGESHGTGSNGSSPANGNGQSPHDDAEDSEPAAV